jgi:NhaP-type Na+/H+ or K+/H+ antiporter
MGKLKKISVLAMVFTFLAVSTASAADPMQRTLRDSLYGGLIGALLGSAVMLLTDNPDDHLNYIPTGAAVGLLVGAAYGVATSGVMSTAAAEINTKEGSVSLAMPTISTEQHSDEQINKKEDIEKIELVRLTF